MSNFLHQIINAVKSIQAAGKTRNILFLLLAELLLGLMAISLVIILVGIFS